MNYHLNYSLEDPNYIFLCKIFKIIGSRKSRTIIVLKVLIWWFYQLKLFYGYIFKYNCWVVVHELKRDKKLGKFFEISAVPNILQISIKIYTW